MLQGSSCAQVPGVSVVWRCLWFQRSQLFAILLVLVPPWPVMPYHFPYSWLSHASSSWPASRPPALPPVSVGPLVRVCHELCHDRDSHVGLLLRWAVFATVRLRLVSSHPRRRGATPQLVTHPWGKAGERCGGVRHCGHAIAVPCAVPGGVRCKDCLRRPLLPMPFAGGLRGEEGQWRGPHGWDSPAAHVAGCSPWFPRRVEDVPAVPGAGPVGPGGGVAGWDHAVVEGPALAWVLPASPLRLCGASPLDRAVCPASGSAAV